VNQEIALYIHVPFCRRKCRYCSFVSYAGREAVIPGYVDALKSELTRRSRNETIGSIYFGGGTPSLIPVLQVADILDTARSLFTFSENMEISIEANPGTIDRAYLSALRKLGVSRLSLGVQSLDETELAMLGRIHTAAQAVEAVQFVREAGFDNLNIDLIYGLPQQTIADWRRNLEAALTLAPEHISLYALTLEENVPMSRDIAAGLLPAPDPDIAADQYELAEDILSARGYLHYEISNWALPGHECRHNLVYWQNRPYLGIGVAAHSCLDGHRTANTSNLDLYLAGSVSDVKDLDEEIGPDLELAESVILGLRLSDGIRFDDVSRRFGKDILVRYRPQIREMENCGLLEEAGGNLKLTRRGRLLSNEVFWRFLPD
jgi:oxygen-independent coproporphyrinogen III oxidase